MYGIFTYIWFIFVVNVGTYTIHESYGKDHPNKISSRQISSWKKSWVMDPDCARLGTFPRILQAESPEQRSFHCTGNLVNWSLHWQGANHTRNEGLYWGLVEVHPTTLLIIQIKGSPQRCNKIAMKQLQTSTEASLNVVHLRKKKKTLLPIRLRKGRIYKGRSEQVFTKASLRSPGRKRPLSNKGEQVLYKKPWWFKNSLLQGEFLGVPGGWGGGGYSFHYCWWKKCSLSHDWVLYIPGG